MNEIYEKSVTKNEKGQIVRKDYSDGSFVKYEYNQNGNLSKFERSDGYYTIHSYDNNNNPLQIKHSTGLIQNWIDNKWKSDFSEL